MKDLLIGGADLYDWSKIKVWATSARQSGFTGDIVLLTYRVSDDVVPNAEKLGIEVYQINHDPFGRAISHNAGGRDTQAHQMRFFHMWQFLSTNDTWKNYRCVITTDVRDVLFQKNPSEWLTDNSDMFMNNIVASSEGIQFKNELWNADNFINGFGPLVYDIAKEWTVYNVGVLAGNSYEMMGLCLILYNLTVGRYIPSDQSAYAILINSIMKNNVYLTDHSVNWAAQCGVMLDPEKVQYKPYITDPIPLIENGVVYSMPSKRPFTIVHQYDRVPELKLLYE